MKTLPKNNIFLKHQSNNNEGVGGEGTIYKPSLTFHLGEGLNGKPNIGRVN